MRITLHDLLEKGRVCESVIGVSKRGDRFGLFIVNSPNKKDSLRIIFSDGADWALHRFPLPVFEHASVTVHNDNTRCPTWEEMAHVKKLIWEPTECVLQYHPPEADNISHHPTCLHLWRPVGVDIPMPPKVTIAPPKESFP